MAGIAVKTADADTAALKAFVKEHAEELTNRYINNFARVLGGDRRLAFELLGKILEFNREFESGRINEKQYDDGIKNLVDGTFEKDDIIKSVARKYTFAINMRPQYIGREDMVWRAVDELEGPGYDRNTKDLSEEIKNLKPKKNK